MNNYLNFFSPPTISVLFCLYQLYKRSSQLNNNDGNNKIIDFVIQKIMRLNQQASCTTNQQFEAQLFSVTDDDRFLQQYRNSINTIESLNDFYRFLSSSLKELRSLKNNKTEQGNIIDLFLRRLILYFSKFDFKQLVNIYEEFKKYKNNQPIKPLLNEFTVSKKLEQIRFNIQNYGDQNQFEQINQKLQQLEKFDRNFKVYYLKALNQANGKKPISSTNNIHKYFDKSLGNLFQQKNQSSLQNNNVNHCILSLAYMNLKLGFIDQSLKSISQGLRISQNNSDAQSINHCIIYLYQIASYLGKYNQHALLTQHAITHSLNLNNILLMLFSCLNYSEIERYYDCSNKQLDMLNSRNLKWTDALHFSKKKIYSNFENSCKSLFHSQRNLTIPHFLHKLAVLIHLPQLKDLFLFSLKNKPQLLKLDKFKLFLQDSKIEEIINEATITSNRCQNHQTNKLIHKLNLISKYLHEPKQIIKIWAFKNQILIKSLKLAEAYNSVQKLILFCKSKGFIKQFLIQELFNLLKIQIFTQNYIESLTIIQEIKNCSSLYNLTIYRSLAKLYKAKIYTKIGYLSYPLKLIQKIQQSGDLENFNKSLLIDFYQIKIQIYEEFLNILSKQGQCKEEQLQISTQIQSFYEQLIKLQLQSLNFEKFKQSVQKRLSFLKEKKMKLNIQKKLIQILDYTANLLIYFKKLTVDYSNGENTSNKILSEKIRIKLIEKLK